MKHYCIVFALILFATSALAGKKYIPGCVPSPNPSAPACAVKDEPGFALDIPSEKTSEVVKEPAAEIAKPAHKKSSKQLTLDSKPNPHKAR